MPHKDPEARRAYFKARYWANREALLAKQKAWRQTNPASLQAYQRPAKDPEAERAYKHAWYLKNRERRKPLEKAYREQHRAIIHARIRAWQRNNPERTKAYALLDKVRHPERIATTRQVWAMAHREQINANARARYHANPERSSHKAQIRRARQKGTDCLTLSAAQWREIKDAFGHRCAYCGKRSQRLTQDHIIPLSKGGTHSIDNVVPACKSCNSKKHAGPPPVPVQPLLLTIAPAKKEQAS